MDASPRARVGGLGAATLLLPALALAVYANSLNGPFIFDDEIAVERNESIRRLWPIWDVVVVPPRTTLAGRPVVSVSFAINYALGGLDVWGYHAVNLGLHILSGLALYGITRRTLTAPKLRDRFGRAASALSLAVAAVWLVHPLHTETLNYVAQRTELLMALLYLTTLYAAVRAWESTHRPAWYAASIVSCGLAMGSKEVAASAPLMVALYDRSFVCTSFRDAWQRRWPLYAGLAATWGILASLLIAYDQSAVLGRLLGRVSMEALAPWEYAVTQLTVVVDYLRLAVWPDPLCLDRGVWVAGSGAAVLASGALIGTLLAATACALWRGWPAGFLGAWFFLILAPTSSVVPIYGEVMAERRMYLPLAAVVVLAVVGGYAGVEALLQRTTALARERRGLLRQLGALGAFLVLVAALGYLTRERNGDYRSQLSIWSDTVEKSPDNPRAHLYLGNALLGYGRPEDAVTHYAEAVRLKPGYTHAHANLATVLLQLGRLDEAIARYGTLLELDPSDAEARSTLALTLARQGQIERAIDHYTAAVRTDPKLVTARVNLALLLTQEGRLEEAITEYRYVLRMRADIPAARYGLANALLESGAFEDAVPHYEAVLRISPAHAEARSNLGTALLNLGRVEEAIAHYSEALRIVPRSPEIEENLRLARERLADARP